MGSISESGDSMDVKSVMKNIKNKGLKETIRIHQDRDRRKNNLELKEEIIQGIIQDSFASQKENYKKYLKNISEGDVTEEFYENELKSIFIKHVFSRIYNEEAKKPVENKIVFMDRGGSLSVSLAYMYKYIKKNTDYKLKKYKICIRKTTNEDYYERAKEYIRDAATAKAVFICTANDLMSYITLRPETTYIQLWHGCGVFKKVGLSTIDKKFGKSAKSHEEYPLNTNYSYVTIASPELSWIFEESMGIDKESGVITPTGISRTDEFFDEEFISGSYRKLYEKIPQARDKKVILYAPTFRGDVATCTTPDVLDIAAFARELKDEYILILKHHPTVKKLPEIPKEYENTFAYDMTRKSGMNINELMTVADICISDYSSVVFEYSLFERPMLFYVYDLEDYIDERGLYYDFDEITPGPLCRTNEEMLDYIKHIDERFDKQEVTDFKNKFMCCCDGHSSERILALVEDKE